MDSSHIPSLATVDQQLWPRTTKPRGINNPGDRRRRVRIPGSAIGACPILPYSPRCFEQPVLHLPRRVTAAGFEQPTLLSRVHVVQLETTSIKQTQVARQVPKTRHT